jgi:enoyl-CoA hydratase
MHPRSETIHVDDRPSGVRTLTLDRPPANALDDELLDALAAHLDEAALDDEVRAVVLRGQGRFFCGGFDLRAPRREGDAVDAMVTRYRESHRKLLGLTKPTIAAVQGHALAGGLVLALACDHRLAVEGDYKIGLNETAIGAAFPGVAMEIVRLRLGNAALTELLLGAEVLSATDLVRLGVVSRLTPAEQFDAEVVALADRVASYPREVYAHAKAELVGDALARLDAISIEQELATAALWTTPESRAARAAQRRRLED